MSNTLELLNLKGRIIKLLFLIAVLVTTGCQKDETVTTQGYVEKDSGTSINYISGNEIPKIIDFIQPNADLSSEKGTVSTPFGSVAIENILKTIDNSGNDNYSFLIQPRTPKPNSIFNLSITFSDQNDEPSVAIVEYRMALDFAEDYHNEIKSFSEFKGNIYTFPFSAESDILQKDVCIQNIDEVVNCDLVVVDGGGTGTTGGGGTTTIGDTVVHFGGDGTTTGGGSSGGPVGASLSWVCNAYHEDHAGGPVDCCCSSQGGSWVLTIISNTKSSNFKQGANCCDNTTLPGPVGVNLLSPIIDYIRACVPLNIGEFSFLANSPNAFPLRSFVQNNGCTNETKEIVKTILEYGASNRFTAPNRETADIIIADLLNGLNTRNTGVSAMEYLIANNKIFYVEPKGDKVNPEEETKCFDLTKPAKITIYVEQPIPNSREITANIGHTFVGIEQGEFSRALGFYPDSPTAALMGDQDSEIHDNSGSPYHVSISVDVSPGELSAVINYINNYPSKYELQGFNCSDFGIEVAEKFGLNLPKTIGEYDALIFKFEGRNPADLGEDIRSMTPPSNGTINKTGGNAPTKKGNC